MANHLMTQTRRQFVLGLAGGALAYPGTGNNLYNPKLAVHTSIWVSEAAARKKQPADMIDEAFGAIQRAGYRRVELAAEFTRPDVLGKTLGRLGRFGLEPSIVAAGGRLYGAEAEAVRAQAATLALSFTGRATFLSFTCSQKPDGSPKTLAELDAQAYQLNLLGLDLERTGVRLLLDHDVVEMTADAREWRHMVAHTEDRAVSLCLDVESAIRAGASPWPLIEAAAGRLRSVHLRNTRHGVDEESLAEGDIDLAAIAKLLREELYDGFLVVELRRVAATDRRRSPEESLAWSRWRMQEIFGSRPGAFPVDIGPHVRFRKPPSAP
jgi:sugar phosphate isomerase/epimerase